MNKIWIKIMRDIKEYKERFIALFLIIFIGAFIFTGLLTTNTNFSNSVNKYYTDYNLADIWISNSSSTSNFSLNQKDIDEISKITGIKQVQGRNSFIAFNKNEDMHSTLKLHSLPNNASISIPYIESGNIPTSKNEIIIDTDYAKTHNLSINDDMYLYIKEQNITFKITGFCENPEYILKVENLAFSAQDSNKFGIGYISENALQDIFGSISYNEALIDLEKDYVYKDLFIMQDISSLLNDNTNSKIYNRVNNQYYSNFQSKKNLFLILSTVAAIVFIILSLVISIITLRESIKIKREEFGILKALGIKSPNIISGYLLISAIIALSASLFGSLLGSLIIPNISFFFINKNYTIPILNNILNINYIIFPLLIYTLLLLLITYKTCNKVLKQSPLKAMKEQV